MCATCGCGKKGAMPYNKKNDKAQDAKSTKGLNPKEKAAFEKADKKHRKPKNQADDKKIDTKIIAGIKKKEAKKK